MRRFWLAWLAFGYLGGLFMPPQDVGVLLIFAAAAALAHWATH